MQRIYGCVINVYAFCLTVEVTVSTKLHSPQDEDLKHVNSVTANY